MFASVGTNALGRLDGNAWEVVSERVKLGDRPRGIRSVQPLGQLLWRQASRGEMVAQQRRSPLALGVGGAQRQRGGDLARTRLLVARHLPMVRDHGAAEAATCGCRQGARYAAWMADADDLRRGPRRMLAALTPHPHRGDLIAAGAAPFTIGVLLVNARLDGSWSVGAFLVVTALACALVLGMGVLAPLEGERPRAYQQVLLLTGLALLLVVLVRVAQVLGVHKPLGTGHAAAGTRTWIFAVLAVKALWLTTARRSAVCALVAALAALLATLSFVQWAFTPSGLSAFRWVLLLAAGALVLGALAQREHHRRESVYLVDAAGIAIVLLSLTWVGALLPIVTFIGLPGGVPGGAWKGVLLAADLGLVAYAAVDREPGPGYIGALTLLLWIALVRIPGNDGASVWFWPLVLVLVGIVAIVGGLRPRRPLPPEPSSGHDDAPVDQLPGAGAPTG